MELKNFLHLYTNCQLVIDPQSEEMRVAIFLGFTDENRLSAKVKYRSGPDGQVNLLFIKPILRRLEDMTDEERSNAIEPMTYGLKSLRGKELHLQAAELTNYLLARRFDLFGLIDAGLAVTKSH